MTLFEEVKIAHHCHYVCVVRGKHHRFETMTQAEAFALKVFVKTGIILGIERVVRRRHSEPFAKRASGYARRTERRNKRHERELALS